MPSGSERLRSRVLGGRLKEGHAAILLPLTPTLVPIVVRLIVYHAAILVCFIHYRTLLTRLNFSVAARIPSKRAGAGMVPPIPRLHKARISATTSSS